MNLLDLLSDDPPADPGPSQVDMHHYLGNVDSGFQPVYGQAYSGIEERRDSVDAKDSSNNVIYLPARMSPFQRDVCELIVQIFRKGFEQELQKSKNRASISNLSNNEDEMHGRISAGRSRESSARLINLMFEQLRKVSMHPSLLVDHFIPKRWLLLEVNERLLNLSGKLALFDRIVDLLCDTYSNFSKAPSEQYNVLVMAESVKELEWIEGSIIGKELEYHNLNTRKLYDKDDLKKEVKEEFTEDELFSGDNRNKKRHHLKRRRQQSRLNRKYGLVLHLATSRHMYESYTSSVQFDLIFSFDSHPDLESASMQLIRSNNKASSVALLAKQFRTPIIIPVPTYSLEHYSTIFPRPEDNLDLRGGPDAQVHWKLKVISAFVANRYKLYDENEDNFFVKLYGNRFEGLKQWLVNWWGTPLPAVALFLEESRDSLQLHPSEEKLLKQLRVNFCDFLKAAFSKENHKFKFENPSIDSVDDTVLDFDTLKKRFAEALNHRTELVETIVRRGLFEVLPKYRKAETERQTDIDACEDQMGERYKKLRKLNEEASAVERKYNRAEAENTRVESIWTETKEMLKHLDEVIQQKSDEEIKKLVEEQTKVIEQLNEEKGRLRKELTQVAQDGEARRGEYQTKSAAAVNATAKLNDAIKKQESLHGIVNGPGMHILPSLQKEYEQMNYELRANKLRKENAFLKLLFLSYLDKMVKERNATVDNTGSGLSSRPSNRVSRGSTPFN